MTRPALQPLSDEWLRPHRSSITARLGRRRPGSMRAVRRGRLAVAICLTGSMIAVAGGCSGSTSDSTPSLLTKGANECHEWARSRLHDGERIEFPTGDDDRVSLSEGRAAGLVERVSVELGTPYVVYDGADVVEAGEFLCIVAERGGAMDRLALNFRG